MNIIKEKIVEYMTNHMRETMGSINYIGKEELEKDIEDYAFEISELFGETEEDTLKVIAGYILEDRIEGILK